MREPELRRGYLPPRAEKNLQRSEIATQPLISLRENPRSFLQTSTSADSNGNHKESNLMNNLKLEEPGRTGCDSKICRQMENTISCVTWSKCEPKVQTGHCGSFRIREQDIPSNSAFGLQDSWTSATVHQSGNSSKCQSASTITKIQFEEDSSNWVESVSSLIVSECLCCAPGPSLLLERF